MQFIMLVILILISFYTDARYSRIPNTLTLFMIGSGFILHSYMTGWSGLSFAAGGMGVGLIVFALLYSIGAVGAGDVKLFGAIGALMGVEFTLYSMMYSIVFAGIIGVVILMFRQEFFSRLTDVYYYFIGLWLNRDVRSFQYKGRNKKLTFPFMYAVLPAVSLTSYLFIGGVS